MSLSIVGVCEVLVRDGMVQLAMLGRVLALLPQQLAVERGRRWGKVQQRRWRATAIAVRHTAPLALLRRTGGAAGPHSTHTRVGPIVRISRAHYHTVVLLGGHGAGNTIRARNATHFTPHFTLHFTRLTAAATLLRLWHFLFFHALGFLTDFGDITTCTCTFCYTWNNEKRTLIRFRKNALNWQLWRNRRFLDLWKY